MRPRPVQRSVPGMVPLRRLLPAPGLRTTMLTTMLTTMRFASRITLRFALRSTMRCRLRFALLAICAAWMPASAAATDANAQPAFDPDERDRIAAFGPWPPTIARDPSNRWSGDPRAIAFGRLLFDATALSANRTISCATCHRADRGLADGLARSVGLGRHDRNAQTLWNVALQRWFGWDGGADSLWAASIRPILTAHEMGMTPRMVADAVAADAALSSRYRDLFGAAGEPDLVLVNIAKSIAAYLETLISPRAPFDDFRDALLRGDDRAQQRYPAAARRGLKIFIGRGNCFVCHFGPAFSNGEFHDVGRPFLVEPGRVDPGRHAGVRRVLGDRFNLLGRYNDETAGDTGTRPGAPPAPAAAPSAPTAALPAALKTRTTSLQHRNWGEWRTPSLRQLADTAPYMHDGSLATLRDVVRHYSQLDPERLHSDGENLLKPLNLADDQIDDLVAFLRSLSGSGSAAAAPGRPPAAPR